jgi:hypothetical protein
VARGWESKSVEEGQIAGAGTAADRGAAMSPEERRLHRLRRDRELSRQLVVKELAGTPSEARRQSLLAALAFLDEEIRKLSD